MKKGKTKVGYASSGKIEKKRFTEYKVANDIPKSEAKLQKWFEMREAQIRKKRDW
jgi:hypothetical protein